MAIQENFEARIREIAKLKKGWHFGDGDSFGSDHIEVAVYVANRYFKMYGLNVSGVPNLDGSIDLTFSHDDLFLDVKIFASIKDVDTTLYKGLGKNRIVQNWGRSDLSHLDEILLRFERTLAQTL